MPKDGKKAPLKLCRCIECKQHTSTDHKTGREVRGLYVSKYLYYEHKKDKGWRETGPDTEDVARATWQATLDGGDTMMTDDVLFDSSNAIAPRTGGERGREVRGDDMSEEVGEDDEEWESEGDEDGRETGDGPDIRVELEECETRIFEARESFHARSENIDTIHFEEGDPVDLATIPPLHHVGNQELLKYRSFLNRLRQHLESLDVAGADLKRRKVHLQSAIDDELRDLQSAISRAWEARKVQLTTSISDGVTVIQKDARQGHTTIAKVVFAYLATVVCLALMDHVSRNGTSFLLLMIRSLISTACIQYVRACSGRGAGKFPNPLTVLGNGHPWPTDLRTAIAALEIDPDTVVMACCRTCRSIYEPTSDKEAPYPLTCTYKAFASDVPCGAKLVKDTDKKTPLFPFLYQRMENWLNRMLSRKVIVDGIQEMSRSWAHGASKITDMMFAQGLRDLLGVDGRPFMAPRVGELRLAFTLNVFTLNVDWFNPFGRRTAGKHASVGGIYMVCMSLPIHLRYRVENIYLVGIIPGPNEPNVNQINHVLRPLVDSLLRFWHKGVRYSWTACHPNGCLVRAVVAALICDIPAMRKVGGFAGHSANLFCSFCKLLRSQVANLEKATWPRRTTEDHMEAAKKFRDAQDKKTQKKEFEENGVRWSELLRLPYWDPLQFSVVDSMHNLFLNNCKQHCREVWGMDSGVGSNKKMPPHDTSKQSEEIQKVKEAIKKSEKKAMGKVRKSYLEAFVQLNFVRVVKDKPTKDDLVAALVEWRNANKQAPIAAPSALPYPIYNFPLPGKREVVLNAIVLMEVVNDIKKTSLPNWIAGPPQNLGSKKQGKLSADQWRTVCTISLVITLVRLWSGGGEFSTSQRWLDNFLDLVVAIRYATKRSVSGETIAVVEQQLSRYLEGLVDLFGAEVLTINHHLSLHLPDFLRRLGPVHGWWTFAFERYNGIIQRFNTNNKFGEPFHLPFSSKTDPDEGELESTFMRTFCRGGNLRSMLAELPNPDNKDDEDILQTLKQAFDTAFSTQFKGTLKADLLALGSDGKVESQDGWEIGQEEYLLPGAIYQMVSSRIDAECAYATHNGRSQLLKRYKIRGLDFTTKRESKGNAQILFRVEVGGEMVDAVGQIETIFRHRYSESLSGNEVVKTYFVVKRYQELDGEDALRDPYRKYPLLDARLCYNKFEDKPYVVVKREIIAHVATCPMQWEEKGSMVILNLDRD